MNARRAVQKVRPIFRSVVFVWKSSRKWTITLYTVLLLEAVVPLGALYLLKKIVDEIASGATQQILRWDVLLFWIGLWAVTFLLSGALRQISEYVSEMQNQSVTDFMSSIVQDKALSLDMGFYDNPDFYDTLHRAQAEGMYRPVQVTNSLAGLAQGLFSLLALGGLLFLLAWWVPLLLVVAALPALGAKIWFSRKLVTWQRQKTHNERRAWYMHEVMTTEGYAKEVRLFTIGPKLRASFDLIRKNILTSKRILLRSQMVTGVAAQASEATALGGLLVLLAWRVWNTVLTLGDMVMYLQAFQRGQAALSQCVSALARLYQHRLFLSYLFELLDIKTRIPEPENPVPLPKPIQKGVSFKNVSFSYPGVRKNVLKNVSVDIPATGLCAIVGKNGSGKSTMVKLLCRLYDPGSGEIQVDGIPLLQLSPAEWRTRLSAIFQDFAQYNFTVAENISMEGLTVHDPYRLKWAAGVAGATSLIDNLDDGYEQMLGRHFDEGYQLSDGQWQRIALARAFYRDSDILILDEPASHLDPIIEHKMVDLIRETAKTKTVFWVTHRLTHLQHADQIIVMDAGTVVATGTHDSLIEQSGIYQEMFESQLVTLVSTDGIPA